MIMVQAFKSFCLIWINCFIKYKKTQISLSKFQMVGKTGFEPATPWSQTKCSTKLSHFPIYGALEGIRTPDLLVRSQTLYPTELRAHDCIVRLKKTGGSSGNRTSDTGIFSPLLYQLSYEAKYNGGLNGTRTRDLLRDRQTC